MEIHQDHALDMFICYHRGRRRNIVQEIMNSDSEYYDNFSKQKTLLSRQGLFRKQKMKDIFTLKRIIPLKPVK